MTNRRTSYDRISLISSKHAGAKSTQGTGTQVAPGNRAPKPVDVDRVIRTHKKRIKWCDELLSSDETRDPDDLSPILGSFSSPWEGAEQWKKDHHHLSPSKTSRQRHDDPDRATASSERRRRPPPPPNSHGPLPDSALPSAFSGASSSASTQSQAPSVKSGDNGSDTSNSEQHGCQLVPFVRRLELIEQRLHDVLALKPARTEKDDDSNKNKPPKDEGALREENSAGEEEAEEETDDPASLTLSLRALGVRAHPVEHAVAIRFVKPPKPLEVDIHVAAVAPPSPEMSPLFDEDNWGSSYPGLK